MKGELLSMIEFLEKDRGLERGTVMEAVEQAIEAAARKIEGLPPGIRAKIDPQTGEIQAWSEVLVVPDPAPKGEEVADEAASSATEGAESGAPAAQAAPAEVPERHSRKRAIFTAPGSEEHPAGPPPWPLSKVRKFVRDAQPGMIVRVALDMEEFGRIAAQTAKQVIIQRIREAERIKILTEYTQQIGDLVLGTVSRFERGNLIVDIGKTEALLPKHEQSPLERYRPGDRLRALVLDVRDTEEGRVPRVILSRANPGLIRRLFEIEVPEIYDGIVEIKSIAREPGFRTKVAVVSHDAKIDPVGACVGMRGVRVKNIVQEIGNEKIDIVRWSDNIEEFVANALQPVEIVRTFADPDTERILVVVPDDQLTLAVGRNGQNIRLTSKLTGWRVDVVRQSEADRVAREHGIELAPTPQTKVFNVFGEPAERKTTTVLPSSPRERAASIFRELTPEERAAANVPPLPLTDVAGITPHQVEVLAAGGITTLQALLATPRERLLDLPGIGEKTLEKIMEAAHAALAASSS
ncbi:MAG: transcription termination factor NusA [bacterium]|nr:transcription termination factor NusA [bacterium]